MRARPTHQPGETTQLVSQWPEIEHVGGVAVDGAEDRAQLARYRAERHASVDAQLKRHIRPRERQVADQTAHSRRLCARLGGCAAHRQALEQTPHLNRRARLTTDRLWPRTLAERGSHAAPTSACRCRVRSCVSATVARLASASPRKPSVATPSRSSASANLLVACRTNSSCAVVCVDAAAVVVYRD